MPGRSSNSSKLVAIVVVILLTVISTPVQSSKHPHTPECNYRYYAIGFWYNPVNLNNQTLGVYGRITVYDNKINGTGVRVLEFVQILFYDGSWLQIGYLKEGSTGELKYYWEYCIYAWSDPYDEDLFEDATTGSVPEFKIYRLGASGSDWVWDLLKDGLLAKRMIIPQRYSTGRAEAALESVDSSDEITYNEGTGLFTSLKYYYGGSWSNWNAIKFTNGRGKAGAEFPPDSPYHVKALNTNAFKTWGDYDADP
ncbi:MAG: hypothetical protein QXI36_00350 [Candidatus Bathyarchaeia archaeon]